MRDIPGKKTSIKFNYKVFYRRKIGMYYIVTSPTQHLQSPKLSCVCIWFNVTPSFHIRFFLLIYKFVPLYFTKATKKKGLIILQVFETQHINLNWLIMYTVFRTHNGRQRNSRQSWIRISVIDSPVSPAPDSYHIGAL